MESLRRFSAGHPFTSLVIFILPWLYLGIFELALPLALLLLLLQRSRWGKFLGFLRRDVLLAACIFFVLWSARTLWEATRVAPPGCWGKASVLGYVEREASIDAQGRSPFRLRVTSWRSVPDDETPSRIYKTDFSATVSGFHGTSPAWGQRVESQGELVSDPQKGPVWKWKKGQAAGWAILGCDLRDAWRTKLFAALDRSGPTASALAQALLLGDTDRLSSGEKTAFRQSGTSHVLALSGMHLSLLALIVSSVVRGRVSRWAGFVLVQLILAIFCWLAGPLPSLYRAWTMAFAVGVSRLIWRGDPPLESLSQSFLLTVLLWPDMASSLSLQLSAAALAGILLLSPSAERFLRPYLGRWAAGVVAVSGSAVAATSPISAGLSGGLCWIGVFWTPPMVFLTSVFLALSVAFLSLALILPFFSWESWGFALTFVRDATFAVARLGSQFSPLPVFLSFALPGVWGVGALAFFLYKGRRRPSPLPLNYDSPHELQAFLEQRGLNTLKRWGQNFLINPGARRQILAALELAPGESVWEVGPGLGALTHHLLEDNHPVTAFEIDPGFVAYLREEFGNSPAGFCLVWGDAIKTWRRVRDGLSLSPEEPPYPDFARQARKVVGNLPYNAASAIIADFLEGNFHPEVFVVTVQKEMAERMTASPGSKNYSSFSVLCQSVYKAKTILTLRPGSFHPAPEVTSCVVALKAHGKYPGLDVHRLSLLVRECFSSRRKTLRNNLAGAAETLGMDHQSLLVAVEAQGIDLGQRAETLSVETFVHLAQSLVSGKPGAIHQR
jgi:16S rRNA (adenine1518-N6/adenine1519-N6)-dimethyltransferase